MSVPTNEVVLEPAAQGRGRHLKAALRLRAGLRRRS